MTPTDQRQKRKHPFWIKERHNPQLGTYYVAMGRMSKTAAKKHEFTIHGNNIMRSFDSEEIYKDTITMLKVKGQRVHE